MLTKPGQRSTVSKSMPRHTPSDASFAVCGVCCVCPDNVLDSVRCTIGLSDDGLVATANTDANTDDRDYDYQLVSGGEPMTEGRHYWEVELTSSQAVLPARPRRRAAGAGPRRRRPRSPQQRLLHLRERRRAVRGRAGGRRGPGRVRQGRPHRLPARPRRQLAALLPQRRASRDGLHGGRDRARSK
jgi:hypothetical protein